MSNDADSTPRSISLRSDRSLSVGGNSLISRGLQDLAKLTATPSLMPSVQTDDTMAKRKRGNFSPTPKDLGSNLFSGPPINADIARGMGMMANGLIKAGKYKFVEFIDAAVEMIGSPAVRYLGPYLEAGWNKKAESDSRLDKATSVSDYLSEEPKAIYTSEGEEGMIARVFKHDSGANKAKGTGLSGAPLTPEIIELLSATADLMVQGIRVKAWSFAEIVADLADTFGRENIPGMREYLERGWDAAVEIEGVEPANYDKVFKEIEIPVVSNEESVDGDWDKAHADLASEAVQRSMAVGMEGVEGRVYGIREHSPGKWQMVSKPAAKPKEPSEETQNKAPACLDPKVGKKVAKAAKLYIEAGALDFRAFIRDLVEDFGRLWVEDKARYLESAWRTANKLKWVNSPTGRVTDVLTEISPRKQTAQNPEAAAEKLKRHGLKVEQVGSDWVVSGKTYPELGKTGIGKVLGGQFLAYKGKKAWWFKNDPTDEIAAQLPDRGDEKQPGDGRDSDADVERDRRREAGRPDEGGLRD